MQNIDINAIHGRIVTGAIKIPVNAVKTTKVITFGLTKLKYSFIKKI